MTLREFDLDTKAFVAGGFTLPEAKSGVEWIDADTLLLSSALGEGMATTSGYARTVRLWRRGEPVERAPVLFEVPADRMAAYCSVDDTGANAADVVHRSDRFLQSAISGSAPRPVRAQSSTCRPTSGWKRITTGWP